MGKGESVESESNRDEGYVQGRIFSSAFLWSGLMPGPSQGKRHTSVKVITKVRVKVKIRMKVRLMDKARLISELRS